MREREDLLSGGRGLGLIVFPDMADRLVYLMALVAVGIVRRLPLSACFLLGQALGAFLWLILPGYRRLAGENLSRAFAGEKSSSQIRALTFKHFTTLGANAVCAFRPTREGNTVVIALRTPGIPSKEILSRRAEIIEEFWQLPAKKWLKVLVL